MEKEKFNLDDSNRNETLELGISPDYFNNIPAFMLKNEAFVKEWIAAVAKGEIKNYSEYFIGDQILELSNQDRVKQINFLVEELKDLAKGFMATEDELKKEELFESFKLKVQEIYELKPRG